MMVSLLAALLLLQPDPAMLRTLYQQEFERHPTAQAARDLGLFLRGHGDAAGAHDYLSRALLMDDEAASPEALSDAVELAMVSPASEAAALLQRAAAGKDGALAARAFQTLGHLRDVTGDKPAAVECYRRALALREDAAVLEALAADLEPAQGIPLLERALVINRRKLGPRHPQYATTEASLAGYLLHAGRTAESVRMAREAMAIFEEALGPEHPRTATAATILAWGLRARGDRRGAERLYRRALAIDTAAYGAQHPQSVADAQTLAEFLREGGAR